jgi:hypothetical protein
MQNFSILDYCFDRLNSIKKFILSVQSQNPVNTKSDLKRKRTRSFNRYQIPRKRRLLSNSKVNTKYETESHRTTRRRNILSFKNMFSYKRLQTHSMNHHRLLSIHWLWVILFCF